MAVFNDLPFYFLSACGTLHATLPFLRSVSRVALIGGRTMVGKVLIFGLEIVTLF